MTNEHERAGESTMHEKLCAYVLGEGSGEERMEVERELLRSPELRAQRDTIERTVGLVKDALGKGESLSDEAAETVYSAARPSRSGAIRSSGFLRLAAGIGAVALGFAIVRERAPRSETETACLEDDSTARDLRSPRRSTPSAPAERGDVSRQDDLRMAAEKPQPRKLDEVARVLKDTVATASADPATKNAVDQPKLEQVSQVEQQLAKARLGRDFDVAEAQAAQVGASTTIFEATRTYREAGDSASSGGRDRSKSLGYQDSTEAKVREITAGVGGGDNFLIPSTPAAGAASPPATELTPTATAPISVGATPGSKDGVQLGVFSTRPGGKAVPGRVAAGEGPTSPGPRSALGASRGQAKGEELAKRKRGDEVRDQVTEVGFGLLGETSDEEEGLGFFDDESKSVRYLDLAPADRQVYLERECRVIFERCRRRPNERPRDMFFRFWGDNPFEVAALDPLSTFAADVDTASYALARRYLDEGNVPDKAQIRTEEFVNYFKSDVPAPTSGVFGIHTDLTPSRFSKDADRQMLRVVLRGKDLSKVERPRMNLTFVVDVSGSMREQNRLEMVKNAMRLLITQLTPYDKIGIVKFSTDASVVLPLTSVSEAATIEMAIAPLSPEGSTNSNAGLELGYGMALGGLDLEATNRVVFLSDGVANVGETDPAKIAERVKPMREKGIYLNTIGVGMNNHNDVLLEQLADKADGMCAYIDSAQEAKKQLVDNFSGAFQPIARDVKIQVEFDPAQVLRYRLLGYENRAVADADFRNDKVDAGELGAGHQVTALYEIERQGASNGEKPLATVRVRWKEPSRFGLNPEADSASEISQDVSAGQVKTFEAAGQSYRKAVLAAQFAEILRRSIHARGDSLDELQNEALKLQQELPNDTEFREFVLLVSKSKDLILRTMPRCDELCQAIDSVREHEYRRAQLEQLQREMDQQTLADLQRQNDLLEARLRELIRRRLENQPR